MLPSVAATALPALSILIPSNEISIVPNTNMSTYNIKKLAIFRRTFSGTA